MFYFAFIATGLALLGTIFVMFANGMRSSPGSFRGKWLIIFAWIVVAMLWIAVAFG